jgi:hypothetical protein
LIGHFAISCDILNIFKEKGGIPIHATIVISCKILLISPSYTAYSSLSAIAAGSPFSRRMKLSLHYCRPGIERQEIPAEVFFLIGVRTYIPIFLKN